MTMEEGPIGGGPAEVPPAPDMEGGPPGASLIRLGLFIWISLFCIAVLIRYAMLAQQQHLPGTVSPGGPAAVAAVVAAAVAATKDTTKLQILKSHVMLVKAIIGEVRERQRETLLATSCSISSSSSSNSSIRRYKCVCLCLFLFASCPCRFCGTSSVNGGFLFVG